MLDTIIVVISWLAQNPEAIVAGLTFLSALLEACGKTGASKWVGTLVPDGGRLVRRARDLLLSYRLWRISRGAAFVLALAFGSAQLQACSLEAARARAVHSPARMATPRDTKTCSFLDGVHLAGDWTAGVSTAVGAGALGTAVALDKGDARSALLVTGAVATGLSITALGIGEASAQSWAERCQ